VRERGRDLFSASGVTTVLTMPESLHQFELERQASRTTGLGVRQRHYFICPGVADLAAVAELARSAAPSDSFSIGGLKVFVNGCGHDGLGSPLEDAKWTQDELTGFVAEANRRGLQVWLHSLTAEGVRMAATAVLEATSGRNRLRHRIEHGGDFVDLDDLALITRSGCLMVTTPQFLHSMTADVAGPRAPVRSLLDAGVLLVGGTDSTGTVPASVSILGNIVTAVSRRRADGAVFHPQERLDVEQALRLFTEGSAYGGHLESDRGTLAPGKLADFVVLSHDLRAVDEATLSEVRVLATYVGGEPVWAS
jgi:predicted amidohydrolase YtcJ